MLLKDSDNLFTRTYRGKKVLVFGHTGFKGSWLSLWLQGLGADVYGASLDIPTKPSHYEVAAVGDVVESRSLDIRDRSAVENVFHTVRPDFVFHLAAQALVKRSYEEPLLTLETNALGTAQIMESLRALDHPCIAVLITSDKCYENVETYYGYRETDRLGGRDPYSASKAAAEVVIHGYYHAFFTDLGERVRIASARAGNVVGGGDWAPDRLIPDIVRAWAQGRSVVIRRPAATRPWQHVLEPLSGYLQLGSALSRRAELSGEAFNFGPPDEDVFPVGMVLERMADQLPDLRAEIVPETASEFHEAGLLKLSCDKARDGLRWRPVLSFEETISMTASWYRAFYESKSDVAEFSREQLRQYCLLAAERNRVWTR